MATDSDPALSEPRSRIAQSSVLATRECLGRGLQRQVSLTHLRVRRLSQSNARLTSIRNVECFPWSVVAMLVLNHEAVEAPHFGFDRHDLDV